MKASLRISMCVMVAVVSSQARGLIQYNDGGTYNISTTVNDDVWVDWEAPEKGTTVNVLSGGNIPSPYKLQVFQDSRLNISDGSAYHLDAHDNSQVTVSSSGQVKSYLYAYDDSQVIMSGGTINRILHAYDSSQVTMSGGWIGDALISYGNSEVTMSGGVLNNALDSFGSSRVTITGGTIGNDLYTLDSSRVTITGGTIGNDLFLGNDSILTIKGYDFAIDGIPVDFGNISSMLGGHFDNEPYRRLTGTLLSGDALNNQFRIGNTAQITLIPEPATLLMLSLGGLMLRKRKA